MDSIPILVTLSANSLATIKSLIPETNAWVPPLTALGGAVIGGLISFFPNRLLEEHKKNQEARSVRKALETEVKVLINIMILRGYIDGIDDVLRHLKSNAGNWRLEIKIPDHYSRVYQSHVGKIGMLDDALAESFITFHQFVDAVLQDVIPGGLLSTNGGGLKEFCELKSIIVYALEAATLIVGEEYLREVLASRPKTFESLSSGLFNTPVLGILKKNDS